MANDSSISALFKVDTTGVQQGMAKAAQIVQQGAQQINQTVTQASPVRISGNDIERQARGAERQAREAGKRLREQLEKSMEEGGHGHGGSAKLLGDALDQITGSTGWVRNVTALQHIDGSVLGITLGAGLAAHTLGEVVGKLIESHEAARAMRKELEAIARLQGQDTKWASIEGLQEQLKRAHEAMTSLEEDLKPDTFLGKLNKAVNTSHWFNFDFLKSALPESDQAGKARQEYQDAQERLAQKRAAQEHVEQTREEGGSVMADIEAQGLKSDERMAAAMGGGSETFGNFHAEQARDERERMQLGRKLAAQRNEELSQNA